MATLRNGGMPLPKNKNTMSKKEEALEDKVNHDLRVLCDKHQVSKKGGRLEMIERIKAAKKSKEVKK